MKLKGLKFYMIIAIDETGDFSPKSNKYHFFSAVHIANSENKDDLICRRFYNWESSLPASLKNHNGEIKSARLNELQLCGFVDEVLIPEPKIRISSISFIPVENPWRIINKHKFIPQLGINEGIFLFSKLNNSEMVKFIKDFSFWFRKLNYVGFIKLLLLGNIIYKSLLIKSQVVMQDEKESALRKILNLGHTFAHAYESETKFKIKHGQAVTAGVIAAIYLSNKMGLLEEDQLPGLLSLPMAILPPKKIVGLNKNNLINAMMHDKKNTDGKINFVLVRGVGQILINVEAGKKDILYALEKTEKLIKSN